MSQIVHNGDATSITIPQSFADLSPFGAAGVVCDGVTNTTAAMQALITSIGVKVTTLVFPNTGSCVLSNITFPVNITLDFTQGGSLQVVTGQTVIITGSVRAGLQQIFFNAFPGQGTISLQSTQIRCVYPEWWGAVPNAVPGGNATTNTNAIQAAIYAAYGTNRTNGSTSLQFNRELHFSGLYGINGELKCYHMNGFLWTGSNRLSSGIIQFGSNARIIDGQSVSYGCFDNLNFSSQAPSTSCLIDLDYSGAQGSDIRPQFIDFRMCSFGGSNQVDCGVLTAKSGGGAQGSNIYFWDCNAGGFTGAAAQIGGNNTGRNVGRFYAYNGIINEWWGGDIQGCPLYGLASYAGSWFIDGVSFENGLLAQYQNPNAPTGAGGYDVYCEAPQTVCTMRNVRSESLSIAAGVAVMEYCENVMQAVQFWGNPSSFGLAGSNSIVNQIITGSALGGDGKYYLVSNVGMYTGTLKRSATGGTSTTLLDSAANFTPNAFVGMQVTLYPPNGISAGAYGVVTANDTTSITVSTWTTLDPTNRINNPPAPPTNGQGYVVEPYWGGSPTSCGTVTFVPMTHNVIGQGISGGPYGNGGIQGYFNHCYFAGGLAPIVGVVKNCSFSRADWLGANFTLEGSPSLIDYDGATIVAGPGAAPKPWRFYRNNFPANEYFGITQKQMGTVPVVWSTGGPGGGLAARDTWIGGRSDPNSGVSLSRGVLEYGGILGRATPIGIDQNGASTDIQGGLPTGAGTPGAINFWVGNSGVSGTEINDGSIVGSMTGAGLTLKSGSVIISTSTSPTSAATVGVTGQLAWDQGNIYLCVAGGAAGAAVWKKVALLSD